MNQQINFVSVIVFLLCIIVPRSDCTCNLPTLFDGIWWDSRTNHVTINSNSNSLSGWSVTTYSNTFSTYACVQEDTTHWLFQSTNTANVLGDIYLGFFCVRYKKITDYSYYYYLDSDIQPDAQSVRMSITLNSDIATNGAVISSICTPTSGPSTEEFHVLVKQNQQARVKQRFPEALLGVYAYTVTDKFNVVSCGLGSVWDACKEKTTITLNYTQCSRQMFGSNGGELYATQYFTSGSTTYVMVINGDASTSTRFTCLAISGCLVSSNPGSCQQGQTATTRTSSASSLLISLSAYELCRSNEILTSSPSSSTYEANTTTQQILSTTEIVTLQTTSEQKTTQSNLILSDIQTSMQITLSHLSTTGTNQPTLIPTSTSNQLIADDVSTAVFTSHHFRTTSETLHVSTTETTTTTSTKENPIAIIANLSTSAEYFTTKTPTTSTTLSAHQSTIDVSNLQTSMKVTMPHLSNTSSSTQDQTSRIQLISTSMLNKLITDGDLPIAFTTQYFKTVSENIHLFMAETSTTANYFKDKPVTIVANLLTSADHFTTKSPTTLAMITLGSLQNSTDISEIQTTMQVTMSHLSTTNSSTKDQTTSQTQLFPTSMLNKLLTDGLSTAMSTKQYFKTTSDTTNEITTEITTTATYTILSTIIESPLTSGKHFTTKIPTTSSMMTSIKPDAHQSAIDVSTQDQTQKTTSSFPTSSPTTLQQGNLSSLDSAAERIEFNIILVVIVTIIGPFSF